MRQELEGVLASKTFGSVAGLKNFLQFVVEEALEERGEQIKEYSIGKDVYGRGEAFDSRQDNIVRTEAWRLRAQLSKYYETEGARDPVRIELHKGTYAPAFCLNPVPDSSAQEQGEQPAEQPSPAEAVPPERSWILSRKIAPIALLAIVLTAALAVQPSRLNHNKTLLGVFGNDIGSLVFSVSHVDGREARLLLQLS